MSDDRDRSQNNDNHSQKKGFFSTLFHQFFHKEPKNRDDLVELIRDSEQNELIDPDTRNMLEGVMEIADQRVRDIMIPRSQIVSLNCDQTLEECLAIIVDSAHSRFPVVSADKERIAGILLAKDLLPYLSSKSKPFDINEVSRKSIVVPEGKRVDQMLKEFRAERYHMAIVIDEFGGFSGLVTIEDILELIVGEIDDEFDEEVDVNIRILTNDTYIVSALTTIEDFNEIFSTNFSDDEVDTIGGLVMQSIGHLPVRGESTIIDDYLFKVSVADSRRIMQLHVKMPESAPPPDLGT